MRLLPNSTILIIIPTVVLTGMTGTLPAPVQPAKPIVQSTDRGEWLFVNRVLPLLKEKCLLCHGEDPKGDIKSGLDMSTRAGLLQGGDSGQPAVSPGQPLASRLFIAVTRQDPLLQMPPKENDRLTGEQVETIRRWIAGGAPWPDEMARRKLRSGEWEPGENVEGVLVRTSGGQSDEWTYRRYLPENLWAYQPLEKPAVPGSKDLDTRNPIDAFVERGLKKRSLQPAPMANRRTLIRRITYDVTGLPPTPQEIKSFVRDPVPDKEAVRKVVDRLLASPHYGQHWARHWLDVVRYADSSGFSNDYPRGNAWRYRDYVIRSFNQDKPYNQFIREQIAGDEIDPGAPEMLVAAGFLRMGPWELTSMEVPKIARQRFLDDVTNMVGEVFLSHSLRCARCHDHKFDPIPTRDFYRLQAAFATTQFAERKAAFLPHENTEGFEERAYWEMLSRSHVDTLNRLDEKSSSLTRQWSHEKGLDPTAYDHAYALAELAAGQKKDQTLRGYYEGARRLMRDAGLSEAQIPPRHLGFTPRDHVLNRMAGKGLQLIAWELERYEPFAHSVYSGITPEMALYQAPRRMPANRHGKGKLEQTAILAGGDPYSPTEEVTPGVLSVVAAFNDLGAVVPTTIEGRRTSVANWISNPHNGLAIRSIVNRIWQWHFGQPLAGNPNNFGASGKKPTHPELLDWLGATFVEKDWSLKALHRIILLSDTYRRCSDHPAPSELAEKDPEGTSYAAFRPRRLSAEELRDTLLHVSGELNPASGGIPIRPEIHLEVALQPRQLMGATAPAWQPSPLPEHRHRRSIYALKLRGLRDPFMEVFGEPGSDTSCEARQSAVTAPQALTLLNSQYVSDRAVALAARLMKETDTRELAVKYAFQLAYGRDPEREELESILDHWQSMTRRHESLHFDAPAYPKEVRRETGEENTGERVDYAERLHLYDDFAPDLKSADVNAEVRGLSEVCLVLFNSNEFAYVY